MIRITRRSLLLAGMVAMAGRSLRAETLPGIHVTKDATCPCCEAWVDYLRADGFPVTVTVLEAEPLEAFKTEKGIPSEARSCHTAEVDGYLLEGHVPVADIRRLLAERPDGLGIAVPGMPFGSPGMGPESEAEAYDVVLIGRDGSLSVFSSYPAASG